MMLPPPATPGMPLGDVDTPALLIDLDAFERNLKRMAAAAKSAGVRLRPHAKTHKSPVIALKQIALGAVGMCCQKVSEAEVLIRGGVGNVLVSNEIVGQRKLERLALLARDAKVAVCADNAENVAAIAQACAKYGTRLDVLVEIDVGGKRCGVAPGEAAVALAQVIAREPSLRFGGIQAYCGSAQHIRDHAERKAKIDQAIADTRRTVDLLAEAGLSCDIVGGAGTGTFEMEAASGVYNELQCGSYVFMDADYGRNKKPDGERFDTFENALFVYATVMSTPDRNRAVVDCGHKAASVDSGMPEPFGLGGVAYSRPSDEHGLLATEGANRPLKLGDKILLVPGHCDPTVNLHDWYVCVRGMGTERAFVEQVWPVAARGAGF
jgi:D-serine deaminase-like pyridoxal phosphate-dependent protein